MEYRRMVIIIDFVTQSLSFFWNNFSCSLFVVTVTTMKSGRRQAWQVDGI